MNEIVKVAGPVIDAGNLPEGRGFAIAYQGESICVIGLTQEETKRAAELVGKFVAISVQVIS